MLGILESLPAKPQSSIYRYIYTLGLFPPLVCFLNRPDFASLLHSLIFDCYSFNKDNTTFYKHSERFGKGQHSSEQLLILEMVVAIKWDGYKM